MAGNLNISRIASTDAGTYRCQATNSLGKASDEGRLTVLSKTPSWDSKSKAACRHHADRLQARGPQHQRQQHGVFPLRGVLQPGAGRHVHLVRCSGPTMHFVLSRFHNNRKIRFEIVRYIGVRTYVEQEPYFRRVSVSSCCSCSGVCLSGRRHQLRRPPHHPHPVLPRRQIHLSRANNIL